MDEEGERALWLLLSMPLRVILYTLQNASTHTKNNNQSMKKTKTNL
jgi:hypothetical protein